MPIASAIPPPLIYAAALVLGDLAHLVFTMPIMPQTLTQWFAWPLLISSVALIVPVGFNTRAKERHLTYGERQRP